MGETLEDTARRGRGRVRVRMGMVFQEITTFPMSIFEIVAFGTRRHESLSHAEPATRVEESLARVALWAKVKDRLQSPAGDLSGGQQQRLCMARALSTRPEVVIMGELKRTVTIVLVTHNLQQAARCADQVAFFYLGEMIEAGSAEQMFTAPKLPQTRNYITGRFG